MSQDRPALPPAGSEVGPAAAPKPRVDRRDRAAALLEQGLVSGASFLSTLAAGRWLPAQDLATLGLALALFFFFSGIQRNLVVLPFTFHAAAQPPESLGLRPWSRANLLLSAAVAALVAAGGLLLRAAGLASPWVTEACLGAALLLLVAPQQDLRRQACLVAGRSGVLPRAGLLFALVQMTLLGVALAGGAGGLGVIAALTGSFAASALLTGHSLGHVARRGEGGALALLRREARRNARNLAGHFAFAAYTHLVLALVAMRFSAAETAAFVALRTLTNPVGTVVAGLDGALQVEAGQARATRGIAAVAGAVARQWLRLLAICGPYLLGIALLAGLVDQLVYGGRYAAHSGLLGWWALAYAVYAIATPLESAMLALGMSRTLLWARLAGAAAGLGGTWLLSGPFGLAGAVLGMTAGFVTAAAIAGLALLLAVRRERARAT